MMSDKFPEGNAAEPAAAEVLDLTVEKLVTGGAGLARHDGMAVFVPLTAPGDEVRARVVQRRRGFLQATVEEIVAPGPDRCEAMSGRREAAPCRDDCREPLLRRAAQ